MSRANICCGHAACQRIVTEAQEQAVREFVEWIATQRAFNGAGDPGQALYDYSLNGVLPQWAEEFIQGEDR